MANCSICQNQSNDYECTDCVNREDLVDNFIEMSTEEIAQVKIQGNLDALTQWLKVVEWEKVEFTVKDGFWDKFYLAYRFVSREPSELHTVHCFKNSLLASNGRVGVVISTEIPTELVGKSIIDLLEENVASVLKIGWLDEARMKGIKILFQSSFYNNSLKGSKGQLPLVYYTTWRSDEGNFPLVQIADTVFLDRKHWDSVMELIEDGECFDVYYSGKEEPVLVKAQSIVAAMYPGHIGSLVVPF